MAIEMISALISVNEAAEIIGCSTGCVRRLLIKGELRGEKINERAWAVFKSSAQEVARNPHKLGRPRLGA